MRVHGFKIGIEKYRNGIWYDRERRKFDPKGYGFKIEFVQGKLIDFIPKFWKLGYWKIRKDFNPWHGRYVEYAKFFRFPVIGFFVSACYRKYGIYFGLKKYEATDKHRSPDRYGKWMRDDEFGTDKEPAEYLQLSMRMTNDRD